MNTSSLQLGGLISSASSLRVAFSLIPLQNAHYPQYHVQVTFTLLHTKHLFNCYFSSTFTLVTHPRPHVGPWPPCPKPAMPPVARPCLLTHSWPRACAAYRVPMHYLATPSYVIVMAAPPPPARPRMPVSPPPTRSHGPCVLAPSRECG